MLHARPSKGGRRINRRRHRREFRLRTRTSRRRAYLPRQISFSIYQRYEDLSCTHDLLH